MSNFMAICLLQEQLAQRDEQIAQMQQDLVLLREQVQALQEQLKKDSHNSHLPPSSDRFHRQPKSLRKRSGKKPGGQSGHPGSMLMLSPTPDTVIVHPVERCQHCEHDLRLVESLAVERRQVLDLPVLATWHIRSKTSPARRSKICFPCRVNSHENGE